MISASRSAAASSQTRTAAFARRPFTAGGRRSLVVVANEKQGKGGEEGRKKFDKSCYGIVGSNENYLVLGSLIDKAGLVEKLMSPGPFTLFAPNDDAFGDACKALGTTKLGLRDLPNLAEIVQNHVVAGSVMSADLKEGQEVTMLSGKKFKVTLAGGAKINGATIKKVDIKATNGIIHAVTGVLI